MSKFYKKMAAALTGNKLFTIQEVASILGVSTKTLRRWDQRGRFVPIRTAGNQRRYSREQIDDFLASQGETLQAQTRRGETLQARTASEETLFDLSPTPKPARVNHSLPSVLSSLPFNSFLRHHFLLRLSPKGRKEESESKKFKERRVKLSGQRQMSKFTPHRNVGAGFGAFKTGLMFASLILVLSFAGATVLTKYNAIAVLGQKVNEKKEQFAKFIENLPRLRQGFEGQAKDLAFTLQDNQAVLAATTGDSDLILNINVPTFFSQKVGIGTTAADPSAILDLTSEDRGFLAPRMTEAQIKAIDSPAGGLFVYNTDTNHYNMYDGTSWLGIFTSIGDSTAGEAFTEKGTSGTTLWFYDTDGRGKLTTANLSAARVYTLPDAGGEISLLGQSISNAELVNSKITVSPGTNLTGGGEVALGSSITLTLKDSVSLAGTLDVAGVTTLAGAAALNGNVTLGNAATDTITFTGRVAQDSDLIPIGTTGTNDLGSSALPWDNLYADNVIAGGTSGIFGWLQRNSGALSPTNITDDLLLGATGTSSAKFGFINVAGGDPTATISGNLSLAVPTTAGANTFNLLNNSTLNFQRSPGGDGGLTTALFIQNNGNVGIGTTSPNSLLHVKQSSDAAGGGIRLERNPEATYVDFYMPTGAGGLNDPLVIQHKWLGSGSTVDLVYMGRNGEVIFPKAGSGTSARVSILPNSNQRGLVVQGASGQTSDLLTLVDGNAAIYNTASLGSEKVTNGAFADDTIWSWGANWAHDAVDLEADHAPNDTAVLEQDVSAAAGEIYQVVFTVRNRTAGSVTPQIGGVDGTAVSSNATSSQQIRATGTGNLKFTPTAVFDGSIDDVSVKLITGGNIKLAGLLTGGGSSGIKITAGGNVGIGNTTPLTALDVTGSASLSANLSLRGAETAHTFNILQNGTLNFQRSPGGDAGLATALFIQNNGNVGIGTTAPGAKLELSALSGSNPAFRFTDGDVSQPFTAVGFDPEVTASTFAQMSVVDSNVGGLGINGFTDSNSAAAVALAGYMSSSSTTVPAIILTGWKSDGSTGRTAMTTTDLVLQVRTGASPLVTVQGGGNVGIGTTSPLATLDVRGNLGTTPAASVSATSSFASLIVDNSGIGDLFTASKSGATKFVITNSGNVGIGTANPSSLLNVNGTLTATTINAFTLGGTIAGGGNQLNNIIIGTSTPLAGTFTTLTANGDVTLGNAITDNITFTGRVALDSDLIPIGTTGTNDLGSLALPWDNLYADNIYSPATGVSGYFQRNNGALSPTNITDDLLLGAISTASAKFAITGVAGTTTTATISGNLSLAVPTTAGANTFNLLNNSTLNFQRSPGGDGGLTTALFIQNNGNVGIGNTTPGAMLSVGSSTPALVSSAGLLTIANTTDSTSGSTGSIYTAGGLGVTKDLAVDGGDMVTAAETFNLINTTATTLNIGGAATTLSIGAATGTVTLNNATTAITGALTANGDVTLGNAITDNITFTGRVALDSDLIPIGTTGTNDLGSSALPWDNLYADNIYSPATGVSGYFQRNNGALSPTNITDDLLLGAISTASAKFAITGVAGTTTTATISGNLSLAVPTTAGANTFNLLNNSTLNFQRSPGGDGGLTTALFIQNNGNVGIGTTGPSANLHIYQNSPSANQVLFQVGTSDAATRFSVDEDGDIAMSSAAVLTISDNLTMQGGKLQVSTGGTGTTYGLRVQDHGLPTSPRYSAYAIDVVDGSNVVYAGILPKGGAVFNEQGLDTDFRIEGDNDTALFFVDASTDRVGIGTTSPLATLDVRGNLGTTPAASVSATSSFASLIVDNSGIGDLFTASKSGATKFVITNSGNVGVGTANPSSLLNVNGTLTATTINAFTLGGTIAGGGNQINNIVIGASTPLAGTFTTLTANGDTTLGDNIADNITFTGRVALDSDLIPIGTTGTNDLGSSALPWDNLYADNIYSPASGTSGYWQRASAALSPTNITDDLLLGATSTASAKFGFINVAGGNPTATISGNLSLAVPTTAGANTFNLLNNSTLNFQRSPGGDAGLTTALFIQNNGNVGIGTITPGYKLTVSGQGSFSDDVYISGNIYLTGASRTLNANAGDLTLSASAGNDVLIGDNATILYVDGGTNTIGVGAAATSGRVLNLDYQLNNLASADSIGAFLQIRNYNIASDNANYHTGAVASSIYRGSANLTNTAALRGLTAYTNIDTANAGTITGAAPIFIQAPAMTGTGYTVTSNYGIYMESMAHARVSTSYGIYQTGTGDINYFAGNVGIGTTSPLATLDVRGNLGTTPAASVSATSSFASLIVDNSGIGDLFTASKSGATKFVITNSGNVGIGTANPSSLLNVNGTLTATTINAFTLGGTIAGGGNQLNNIIIGTSTPLAGTFTTLTANGDTTLGDNIADNITFTGRVAQDSDLIPIGTTGTNDLGSLALPWDNLYADNIYSPATGVSGYFQRNNGALSPTNITDDLLLGAISTASAKFAITGVAGTTTTATISGNLSLAVPTTAGANTFNLLNNSTLNFQRSPGGDGGLTTALFIQNNGNVGIGTTEPGSKLSVDGDFEFVGAQTLKTTTGNLTLSAAAGADVLIGDGTTILYVDGGTDTIGMFAAANSAYALYNTKGFGDVGATSYFGEYTKPHAYAAAADTAAILTAIEAHPLLNSSNTKNWTATVGLRALTASIEIGGGAAGTVTGAAGLYVSNVNSANVTLTNQYGLYIEDLTKGVSDYGIYVVGADTAAAYFGDKVGIGNLTPLTALDITGSASLSANLSLGGAETAHTFNILDNGTLNIQRSPGGDGGLTTALFIQNNGNVGIGTTGPIRSLHVIGPQGGGLAIGDTLVGTDRAQIIGYSSDYNAIDMRAQEGTQLWLATDGNIGIGNTTPLTALDVTGSASLSANLSLRGAATAHTLNILQNGTLNFQRSPGGDAGLTTALFIQNNGNVGIGNTTPLTALDITGSASLSANLSLRGAGTAHTFDLLDNGTFNFRRSPGGDGGLATALFIQNNGNVGIGTTAPATLLSLANDGWLSGVSTASGQTTNMFKVNTADQIQVGAALNVDGGITFPTDGGYVTAMDMPFSTTGTNAYVFRMGTSNLLSLYGESDSVGAASNLRVGIGTRTPLLRLDVQDSQDATAAAQIYNTSTNVGADGLILKLGNTSTSVVPSTNHFLSFETFGIGIVGSVQGNGGKGVTYATSGIADFAEYFKKDQGELIPFGSVVCLKDNGLAAKCDPSAGSGQGNIIGVASEHPAFLGGDNLGDRSVPVGLVGQVKTRVSTANGEIKIGDPLTTSNTPGVAVKATTTGQILGKAIEAYDGQGEGSIRVSVNIGWYNPSIYVSYDGTLAGMAATVESIGDQLTLQADILASQGLALQGQAASISASLAAKIASDAAAADYILATDPLFDSLNNKVNDLQSRIDLLSQEVEQQASISAFLTEIVNAQVLGASTSAILDLGDVELNSATIAEDLMVLGRATVTDLGVTGNINAGLLAIHGLEAEINTLSGNLYLQKSGLGGLDILDGKIVIDTLGNMTVIGTITADEIKADNYTVLGDQSIGSATIPAGLSSIEISTPVASGSSKIFLTPTSLTDKQLIVVNKSDGKFKVAIPAPATAPITFDWWIVGNK